MDRLTRPGIDAEQTAVRFMDGEVKIQDIGDKLLNLILNGPTINGIKKDTLRHLVRQLYDALKQYEELDMTPEDIEQTMLRFSSFLMEMTGGRMSKTNYTVQAMVSEANDYQQKECDECTDLAIIKSELAKVEAALDAAMADITRCCATCALCSQNNGTGEMCPWYDDCNQVDGDHWEWRGAKDNNVPGKEEE